MSKSTLATFVSESLILGHRLVEHAVEGLTSAHRDIIWQVFGPLNQPIDVRLHSTALPYGHLQLVCFVRLRCLKRLLGCSFLLIVLLGQQ